MTAADRHCCTINRAVISTGLKITGSNAVIDDAAAFIGNGQADLMVTLSS